ncbi:hypothetical protein [Flavobacterium sp.]|jgi:hypothetical protein|uniref:hypothetical protein n=1 Tax=Flavobacterium sp. TaxID=239 RepID=UPI0037BF249A
MSKNYTKYTVAGIGENLNKRKLVFEIVKDYAAKNNPSFEELQKVFSDEIQGSLGFIRKDSEVKDAKRFNIDEPLTIKNGINVVVSNQWGENIADFLAAAKKLGYEISSQIQEVETVNDAPAPGIENKVNITISGRISNYMFGILGDDAYAECEKAISYATDDIETMEDFVKMYYETTLYDGDGMEIFLENMDMEQFNSNCPLLSEFLNNVKEGNASHLQFYEDILDMSWEQVNIIEDDALITITVDEKEIVSGQKLKDFLGEIEQIFDEEDDPKTIAKAREFWAKNGAEFEMEDSDEFQVSKAANGVLLFNEWIQPKRLTDYKTRERNITVEHDNIVDFDYYFDAVDFDVTKLAFLKFANATDFHESGPEYVGSYLSYNNDIVEPDQNIHRDKGFTIHYEPTFQSCDFLLLG